MKLARELVDDLARDRLALRILALARFHLVRDQRLDLDQLAGCGLGRHAHARGRFGGHGVILTLIVVVVGRAVGQPPQPPMVTLTLALAMWSEPFDISATQTMFCVCASRMRVAAEALPQAGVKL